MVLKSRFRMGNSGGKHRKQRQTTDTILKNRPSLFVASVKRDRTQKEDSESDTDDNPTTIGNYSQRRRMAVLPGQKDTEEKAKAVEIEFVYTVPKSKFIVDPYDKGDGRDYKTLEKRVKGVENDPQIKSILYELFTTEPQPRKSWKNSQDT